MILERLAGSGCCGASGVIMHVAEEAAHVLADLSHAAQDAHGWNKPLSCRVSGLSTSSLVCAVGNAKSRLRQPQQCPCVLCSS